MEIKEVIGIDVSKRTLDCCIHGNGLQEIFENTPKGIDKLIAWGFENMNCKRKNVLFIFEHTGLYSNQLTKILPQKGYLIHIVSGLEIKRSLGITRGKDDKTDAKRIALYGYRIREEVKPYQIPNQYLLQLKRLMSLRKKLIVHRGSYLACLNEQMQILEDEKVLFKVQQEMIKVFDKQVLKIEKEIDRIVNSDGDLKSMQQLLIEIKGIGKVTARFLIVSTSGFIAFPTWRKYASYCGIAPFPHLSGTSVRGKTKVSHIANKEVKVLLHLCALSAIRYNPEMRAYYDRRLEIGKSKMSTLNIIRNKLLARAFAVAKRGTPYIDTMKYTS